jgi:hypothetical protein
MDRDYESIAREAEQLGREDRHRLAERLTRDLKPTKEHKEAWYQESKRRSEVYDRGEMKAYDAEDVMKELRKITRK